MTVLISLVQSQSWFFDSLETKLSSTSSNLPIQCPICPSADPAVWKYLLKAHFNSKHKTLAAAGKYNHLWKLSNFEIGEMKRIWAKRAMVTARQTRKSKLPPLVVLEDHRAQIPDRYHCRYLIWKRVTHIYSNRTNPQWKNEDSGNSEPESSEEESNSELQLDDQVENNGKNAEIGSSEEGNEPGNANATCENPVAEKVVLLELRLDTSPGHQQILTGRPVRILVRNPTRSSGSSVGTDP